MNLEYDDEGFPTEDMGVGKGGTHGNPWNGSYRCTRIC